MTDLTVDSLVHQLKDMIENQKKHIETKKRNKEMMERLEKNVNIIIKRNTDEFCKPYHFFNVKIVFKLLLKIIKTQSDDIAFLKDKLINK
jgi:hypothetical protein